MIEKKIEKMKNEPKPRDDGVELENQFILRLPEEPAKTLIDAIQTNNLKDRMSIKMDADLRYGEVRLDHWLLHAKIVDLPTIVECMKTIDSKSFYKSADVCQIMICKEEPDDESEKESPNKGKKKDPNKVDKKYLWPHGITPPCKNVRKRRFRKTLKKKNVEAPEIEKEVKRLLRIDNDAVNVDYEIINEDVDKRHGRSEHKDYNEADEEYNDETMHETEKTMNDTSSQRDINVESDEEDTSTFPTNNPPLGGVGEHDIFGGEVSSSDDDDDDERLHRHESTRMRDLEDVSRLSADDSHMSDFYGGGNSAAGGSGANSSMKPNEFNKSMFNDGGRSSPKLDVDKYGGSSSNLAAPSNYYDQKRDDDYDEDYTNDDTQQPQLSAGEINIKIMELRCQIDDLKTQQAQKAQEIASIQNATLKQRLQETLDNVLSQMVEKELELKDYEMML